MLRSIHVAAALEIEGESEDSLKPPAFFVGKAFGIDLHDIMFDFAVQRIEHVVEPAAPRDPLAIRPPKRVGGALDHRIEDVDHAQRLARRTA
jgi:hypothetical protein